MFLIRGVMLAGKFRSQHQLNTMSHDDMRNTLIVEIAGRSRQTGLQAFDDNTLAGMGAVLVFLRTARIRDDATLKGMTSDDMRNILIVELGGQTGMSGRALQAMSNIELVKLGLGKPQPGGLMPGSYIRGVLLAGQFRTQHELDGMSSDDMRNTLIVEMAARSNQTNYQALNDFQLAGVGAVMVFLREARLRTDAELKAMSADDQRNVAIVEIGAQTKLGSKLQGLSNMDLVLTAFGMEPINTGRMCHYLDAPGTPQIGIKSYGVKGRPRASQMTWSVSGTVNGVSPACMQSSIAKAFNLWKTAVPALGFNFLPNGGGDIVIVVGDLGAPNPTTGSVTLGSTEPDGSRITFNNNAAVTFVPALPGGNSLLGVAAHEIGHAIGILHSTTPGTLMFPFSSVTETLASEDIAAVRALYGWTPQRPVPGIGTDASPALCVCGPWLVMAWRGIGDDDGIWCSRSTDGFSWSPQRSVPGTGTTDGPALAWDGTTLWLAIRGVPDDDALYWTTSGDLGDHWGPVTQIPGTGSGCAPSLTVAGGVPLLVWRGIPGDDALYYSTWQNPWAKQEQIGGTGSEDRPSVCVGFDNLPRMVWRGIAGDDSLYTTTLIGQFWQPQQQLSWIVAGNGPQGTVEIGIPGSSVGTTITNAGDRIFLAWRGVPGDSGVYFTQATAGPAGQPPIEWSSQALVEGIGTSHRPAIVTFMGLPFMAWKGIDGDHAIYTNRQARS
jgi:Matrixin